MKHRYSLVVTFHASPVLHDESSGAENQLNKVKTKRKTKPSRRIKKNKFTRDYVQVGCISSNWRKCKTYSYTKRINMQI
jgi:hypothetical protein